LKLLLLLSALLLLLFVSRWPRAWAAGLVACVVPLRDMCADNYRDHFFALLEMERTQCDKDIQV
jgi:hypothetical protein